MRYLKWFFLLSKRMLKNPTFLALILLIPLSVFALKAVSHQKSGYFHVGVVNEDVGGLGEAIVGDLTAKSGLIAFDEYQTEEEALTALRANRLDAVWVLEKDLEEGLRAYAQAPGQPNAVARIYRQEDSLKSRLSSERLASVLYPYVSRDFYLQYVRDSENFDLSARTDEEILFYYDDFSSDGELFSFANQSANAPAEGENHYLTAPIRGILSVVTVLCGFASAMLIIREEQNGAFSRAASCTRVLLSLASQLAALWIIGLVLIVSERALGLSAPLGREVLITLLFVVNTALFCTLLQQLIPHLLFFAATSALLTLVEVAACPVFLDLKYNRTARLFFPNTYYISSTHSDRFLVYALLYGLILSALLGLIYLRKRRA